MMIYGHRYPAGLSIAILLLISLSACETGSLINSWQKSVEDYDYTYGRAYFDVGYAVIKTKDQGILLAGASNPSYFPYTSDAYVVKTNASGDVIWEKFIDTAREVRDCLEIHEKEYILLLNDDVQRKIYLQKLDENGDQVWSQQYLPVKSSHIIDGFAFTGTADGNLVITGNEQVDDEYSDFFLLKTDLEGNELWRQHYGGQWDDFAHSVALTDDGGFVIVGQTQIDETSIHHDILAVRTDSSGYELWTRNFTGDGLNVGYKVIQAEDGGLLIVAAHVYASTGFIVLKTDARGERQWLREYTEPNDFGGYCALQADNGDFLIAGSSGLGYQHQYHVYIVRISSRGEDIWQYKYDLTRNDLFWIRDIAYDIAATDDHHYLLTGTTEFTYINENDKTGDLFLLKIDEQGTMHRLDE
ncbi:hypothetical protein ACFL27_14035 [candidate division CSSED10-310 bacterium]|uniref:Bulb-type lectin domain-containing protein n=1 Tax=candidate division CSSED10-310 bacterium TaxID=2855610 RepID=A0ABV6YYN8_UNCC1